MFRELLKKLYVIIPLVLVLGIGIGFSINVSGEEALIPSWIKNTAGFWVDGQIGDQEFIQALQYLVEKDILRIPSTKPVEQIPLSNEQQAEYARIIRDCSRDNEIIAKEYLSKFANVDSLTDNQEESIQSNSERVSICSADIREIESDYCDLFNPSCTETGRFEMYWVSVSKIQSAYEQICVNTGKFCYSNFQIP